MNPLIFVCLISVGCSVSNRVEPKANVTILTPAQTAIPAGYILPTNTISPNRRYGVLVPILDYQPPRRTDRVKNSIIDIKTGRIVADIQADVGFNHPINYHEILAPRWSRDSSLLLWQIGGKWGHDAVALLKIHDGHALWQIDVLKSGQRAILAKTKAAQPRAYNIARKENRGSGSWYPEGLTVDVNIGDGTVSLPLSIQVTLTSNPKQIVGHTNLDSSLQGVIGQNGEFSTRNFQIEQPTTSSNLPN